MTLYNRFTDIKDIEHQVVVQDALFKIGDFCKDILKKLNTNFSISLEGKAILFFDIRHTAPHYYIEIIRETGIINVRGYGQPTIKIIGGGD